MAAAAGGSRPGGEARGGRGPWAALVLLLLALRLALAAGQPIQAYGEFRHDEGLFVRLAGSLARGEWLGPYDQLTLAKRPFFPIFLAAAHRLGMPLPLAEHLLHALACLAFAVALRPLLPDRRLRAGLFMLLLFDPMPWVEGRVLRHRLAAGLSLATLAGSVGLLARADRAPRRLAAWALGTGLALGAFWLTREEAAWILPAVGILLLAAARELPGEGRIARLAALALVPLVAGAMVQGIALVNLHHYGVATVAETAEPPFLGAVSATYRVAQPARARFVTTPEAVRRALYAAVPAYRELEPYLEGEVGARWARFARPLARGAGPRDCVGSAYVWSLRDAAEAAGRLGTAPAAAGYWRRLTREIDQACADGRLDCTAPLRHPLPPWVDGNGPAVARAWAAAAWAAASFQGAPGSVGASVGSDASLAPIRELTGAALTPRAGEGVVTDPARVGLLGWIGWLYALAGPPALLVAFGLVARSPRRPLLWVELALAASAAGLFTILALIDATLFPCLGSQYLVPLSPLVILLAALPPAEALAARLRTNRTT